MGESHLLSSIFYNEIVDEINKIQFTKCDAHKIKKYLVHSILKKTEPLLRKFIILEIHLNKNTCDPDYSKNAHFLRLQLEKKYPLIVNLFFLKCRHICNNISIFFNRIIQDYEEIKTTFHENKNFKVTSINIGLGDDHHNGESVLSFCINNDLEIWPRPPARPVV